MLALLVLVAAAGGSVPGQTAPPLYGAEFLGAAINVSAMNNGGQCVGTTSIQGSLRGWIASFGAPLAPLPLPAGYTASDAIDINDAGVVAGSITSGPPAFRTEAAAWTPNGAGGFAVALLGMLPGDTASSATAINDVGDIVGTSSRSGAGHAVLFTAPGGPLDLTPHGVCCPRSINDHRVMLDAGGISVRRMDLGTLVLEDLGVPAGYASSRGEEINDAGQVAAIAGRAVGNCALYAARYAGSAGWQVLSSCGSANGSYDINGRGDVIMRLNVAPYVFFEGLGAFRIEDLIVAPVGLWYVINGYGIALNDSRQMAVPATNQVTGESGIVLLTPLPVCQPELGFGGPGPATLSVCGGDLGSGTTAEAVLRGALPNSAAAFVAGLSFNPVQVAGGTLVPVPAAIVATLATGATGSAAIAGIPGGNGPLSVFAQCAYLDPGLPGGIGFSNAVEMRFLP